MVVLDDKVAFEKIKRELEILKRSHIEYGIRADKIAPDGTSIATYAISNEFGTKSSGGNIPARPFFRLSIAKNKDKYKSEMSKTITDILDLKVSSPINAVRKIGQIAVDDVKDSILSNIKPENAPSTKKAKAGSVNAITRTLIDEGAMLASVNYVVVTR